VLPEVARLAEVRGLRAQLDDQELTLIERARYAGATWAQIAAALGLASRQAAQQRHERLVAAARARQRERDLRYAPRLAALRAAIADLQRWIDADARWDSRFTGAALVRDTATAARDAPPGPLYALAAHVAADLARVDRARLPKPVQAVAAALRSTLSTDH
jgi:hypothetical protein